jgi:glucokinase
MPEKKWVIGIDLGGTKIGTGLVDLDGHVHVRDYQLTEAIQGRDAVIERMITAAHRVMDQGNVGIDDIFSIGVGSPGPLDIPKGMLIDPPNLPTWRNVPLRQIIQDAMGVPTYLENDANAAAIGEYLYGAGRGTHNMIYVTVSTGVGGGLILNGQIFHGVSGGAGEVGHMTVLPNGPLCGCGNRGCLEALSSGTAIAREGQDLVNRGVPTLIAELVKDAPYSVTAKDVVDAMQQGDAFATEIVIQAMHYLGIGMANLANLFNPELIVIGGGLANLGEKLLDPVRRGIDLHAFPQAAREVQVALAQLGADVGIVGAAASAVMLSRKAQVRYAII